MLRVNVELATQCLHRVPTSRVRESRWKQYTWLQEIITCYLFFPVMIGNTSVRCVFTHPRTTIMCEQSACVRVYPRGLKMCGCICIYVYVLIYTL